MNKFEKEYYESSAWWSGNALLDEGNKKRIEETIKIIPTDVGDLADIGCGNGVFISKLIDLKPKIITTGFDRSVEALKHVRGNKVHGDITNLPFKSNSFDCVTCLEVIEHLNLNDFEIALAELSRISRKYIIIGVPFDEKTQKNVACCPNCKSIFNKDLHLQTFSKNKLDSLFLKNKFRMINFKNVVKSNEIIGIHLMTKIKNKFRKPNILFDSPICIICGYKNDLFNLDINVMESKVVTSSDSSGGVILKKIKDFIKLYWPKREVNGYWAICLYEKIDF